MPFADVDRLKEAAARHAAPIAAWDPFADARRAEGTATHLASFLRRQRRTLRTALNFTGYEVHDPTGISRVVRGEAILPGGGHDLVREALVDENSPVPTRRGLEADRAYYLLVAGGIHEDAVASLRVGEGAATPKGRPASARSSRSKGEGSDSLWGTLKPGRQADRVSGEGES